MRDIEKLFLKCLVVVVSLCAISMTGRAQSGNEQLHLVGHRGAAGLMPENTLPAVQKALQFNVTGIEFDVVISGDHKVVVSHEPWFRHDICLTPEGDTLTKQNQKSHLLYEMPYKEIKKYDCGRLQHPELDMPGEIMISKPLMSELIKTAEMISQSKQKEIKYFVEVKSRPGWDGELQPRPEETARYIYKELRKLQVLDKSYIMAFDERMLKVFHEIDPELSLVYLTGGSWEESVTVMQDFNFTPEIYAPNHSKVDSGLVREVHRRGMEIVPWTVNDYERMTRLLDVGVDGLISDYPNYFEKLENQGYLKTGKN